MTDYSKFKAQAEVDERCNERFTEISPSDLLELIAENEALRKAAVELRRFAKCEDLHHNKADGHEYDEPCKVLARIDAAMNIEVTP